MCALHAPEEACERDPLGRGLLEALTVDALLWVLLLLRLLLLLSDPGAL